MTSVSTTQTQAFSQAYALLIVGKQAKLYRTDGHWYCEEAK